MDWLLRIVLASALVFAGCGSEATTTTSGCVGASAEVVMESPSTREDPKSAIGSPPQVVLPSTLYFVAGEAYRLDYADVISGLDDGNRVDVDGPLGSTNHRAFWEYEPKETGTFTLSITVKDETGATVLSASRPVVVSPAHTGKRLRHLAIGDSITRAGGYVELAVECILGGQAVGTRTYDDGVVCEEGRGGWTVQRYTSRIGEPTGGDSPFLFPAGVDGPKYLGNTSFWRQTTAGDPESYDYDGFQMIARGWRTDGSFLFDTSGYPTNPVSGDVVVDPSETAEAQWKKYDGRTWSAMNPQPRAEFSFSKYLQRFEAAFSSGVPTSVSVMLGTVDFLRSLTDESWSEYRARLDAMIASIRAWDLDVPIVLISSPSGGPEDLWVDQDVRGSDFDRRIFDHARRLLAAYDTAEERARGVYVISFLGVVAADDMADHVHPETVAGHEQMGPWLAGVLAHLISMGEI
ncbi:MAG: hypothetical protein K0Q46_5117 [Rhodococcus erythropolis]|nr:SGNH/GDSL hydrolase family protein [Rhodococcus erythropolis]MDF2898331.1 hypothetical protein [Rhodococcus erythropolis]